VDILAVRVEIRSIADATIGESTLPYFSFSTFRTQGVGNSRL
jgi:hypothetical protein